MKSILIAAALFATATVSANPPAPPSGCRAVTDYAVRCSDRFGNQFNCFLIRAGNALRWQCEQ